MSFVFLFYKKKKRKSKTNLKTNTMDYHFLLHLFHIFVVGLAFIYIGMRGSALNKAWFQGLLVVGLIIITYHAYLAMKKYKLGKVPWVNMFHVLIVGPLLLLIGWRGASSPRYYFEFLLMLGFAAIGYHAYYLVA
jgi:hypothetical protein